MSSLSRRAYDAGPSAAGVQHELARGAAGREVLVQATDLGESVGVALDDAQLAGRRAREQVGERAGDHVRLAEAVHQPEADHRVTATHQRARAQLVLLARGDAV